MTFGRVTLAASAIALAGCSLLLSEEPRQVALTLDPPALQFGTVVVDSDSAPVRLTIFAVDRTPPLNIGLEGSDFELAVNECANTSLEPGELCRVKVVFHPTKPESRSGALTIADDSVPLSGLGIKNNGFEFTPSSIAFGAVVPKQSVDQELMLVNKSGEEARVQLELSGDESFALLSDGCSPTSLPESGDCSVRIRFTPDDEAAFSANLTVINLATDETVSAVSMSGEGVDSVQELLVTVNGDGVVTSDDGTITCSGVDLVSDCEGRFASGTNVTLTAGLGQFDGWAGDCQDNGAADKCVLLMDQDRSVTASFGSDPTDAGAPQLEAPAHGGL